MWTGIIWEESFFLINMMEYGHSHLLFIVCFKTHVFTYNDKNKSSYTNILYKN